MLGEILLLWFWGEEKGGRVRFTQGFNTLKTDLEHIRSIWNISLFEAAGEEWGPRSIWEKAGIGFSVLDNDINGNGTCAWDGPHL